MAVLTCFRCLLRWPTRKNAQHGAALFHATLAAALSDWLVSVAPEEAAVVAGGGCLQNQVLGRGLRSRLADAGFHLVEARRIPPNDGGIALGQAWIAQHHLLGAGRNTLSA